MTSVDHTRMANAIRGLAMDAVEKAKSGHPGLPMGAADIATVLFTQFLKFDAADPKWPDRDRFVLSAGHGSMLLYALLYLTGNADMTLDQLKHFRQLGSLTPGHPENFHTKGIETTTGPLGQGIATSVGLALAEKMLAAEFGKKIVDHHTYVLASDGDLMEGVSQEAIALAGHWKLNKLIVLYDDNGISIDGPTSLADSVDQVKRFKSAGWAGRTDRRPGPGGDRGCDHARAKIQQAVDDRLQDHHRLRRADQGRHRQGAWRGAGRRGTQGRQGKPRHLAGAVLGARRRAESLARGRQPRRRRAQGMGSALCRRCRTASAPNSSAACGTSGRRRWRRHSRRTRRRCWKRRRISPPANRPNPSSRRSQPRCRWNFWRARPISPAPTTTRRNPRSTSRPRRRKAASSITASASTAWRRP